MSLFIIDQRKCKRDGICAAECPARVIVMPGKKDFPSPTEDAEEYCINCGHCVAVCPHQALTLATMPITECPPIRKELLPQADAMSELLKVRRSIRTYKKTPVSHKILQDIIDVARYAPTGSNKQQVHWMVFEKPDQVQKLAAQVIDFTKLMLPGVTDEMMASRMRRIIAAWDNGTDRIMRHAPHLILVHSPADLPFAEADCVIALTYLELYAFSRGLGTCWAGYFTAAANMHPPLREALQLPAGHHCFGAVMVGYPQYQFAQIPKRNAPLTIWR